MDIVQKMKLYNGQELENWSLEVCKKLREEHPDEGFSGISPRYIQDKFSNAVINPTFAIRGLDGVQIADIASLA